MYAENDVEKVKVSPEPVRDHLEEIWEQVIQNYEQGEEPTVPTAVPEESRHPRIDAPNAQRNTPRIPDRRGRPTLVDRAPPPIITIDPLVTERLNARRLLKQTEIEENPVRQKLLALLRKLNPQNPWPDIPIAGLKELANELRRIHPSLTAVIERLLYTTG